MFCKHLNYNVLSWKYANLGKSDQHIVATVKCKKCGKIIDKVINEDRSEVFQIVYEDKFGR